MNRQERIEQDGLTEEPIEFYGKDCEYSEFSNFSPHAIFLPHPFTGKMTKYDYGEIRYQAMKADNSDDHDHVVEARTPGESKNRGREVDIRPGWDDALGYYVMVELVTMKALQHELILSGLLKTRERAIWEDSPTDDIWGIRSRNNYSGKNLLGKAWMQARDHFYLVTEEIGEAILQQ